MLQQIFVVFDYCGWKLIHRCFVLLQVHVKKKLKRINKISVGQTIANFCYDVSKGW